MAIFRHGAKLTAARVSVRSSSFESGSSLGCPRQSASDPLTRATGNPGSRSFGGRRMVDSRFSALSPSIGVGVAAARRWWSSSRQGDLMKCSNPTTLSYGEPRRALHALKLTSGRLWGGTRFSVGVFEPGAYPPRRVRRIRPPSSNRRFPVDKVKPIGTRWDALDGFLLRAFDLPWPRGTILRVPTDPDPVWLTVVDLVTLSGSPATVCEVLDWHTNREPSPSELRRIDTHRTTDTVSNVRARVVNPRNRQSVAKMRRHLGVRSIDERAPFRVTLLGYPPAGVKVVGRRRVVVPASGANAVEWTDLGTVVNRLVSRLTVDERCVACSGMTPKRS